MSRIRCPACAVLLLVAACSSGEPAPIDAPPASGSPRASSTGPAPTLAPFRAPAATGPPAASAPAATQGQPDFSGTGCFPKIPTPFEVTVRTAGTRPVRLTLEIRSTQDATVDHRHGQEFDFSVDAGGREIWRWSAVAPFVDPYGYRFTYETGKVRTFSAVWDANGVPDGDYLAHGFLIANMVSPPPEGRFICFDDEPFRVAAS